MEYAERQTRAPLTTHERKLMRGIGAYALVCFIVFWSTTPARAHDAWANNSAVPSWVKAACCGPADAHVIDSGDVSGPDKNGYYRVKDVGPAVPGDHVFDSQDGETWVFYSPAAIPKDRYVYCLFLSRGF
jgi:hypothetical protein